MTAQSLARMYHGARSLLLLTTAVPLSCRGQTRGTSSSLVQQPRVQINPEQAARVSASQPRGGVKGGPASRSWAPRPDICASSGPHSLTSSALSAAASSHPAAAAAATRKVAVPLTPQTSNIPVYWSGFNITVSEQKLLKAVVTCQAAWRGHRCRQQLAAPPVEPGQHLASAISISSAWSDSQARQQSAASIAQMRQQHREAVSRGRSTTAAFLAERQQRQEALDVMLREAQQSAACVSERVLDRAWASLQCREKAAVCIQQHWHGFVQLRAEKQRQHSAATIIEAFWHGHRLRQVCAKQKRAAIMLQAQWRSYAARKVLLRQRSAAVTIQARQRGLMARRAFKHQQEGITAIQAIWRGRAARAAFLCKRKAAICIQASWRMHAARAAFVCQRNAAVSLQACWRGRLARAAFGRRQKAATAEQAFWRGTIAKQAILQQQQAAETIQACWQGHKARSSFQSLRSAATVCQAHVRCKLAREKFLAIRHAAIFCQAQRRGKVARLRSLQLQSAAIVVQAHWRGLTARRQLAVMLLANQDQAATPLQAHIQGRIVRAEMSDPLSAALVVQAHWRNFTARRLAAAERREEAGMAVLLCWRRRALRLRCAAKHDLDLLEREMDRKKKEKKEAQGQQPARQRRYVSAALVCFSVHTYVLAGSGNLCFYRAHASLRLVLSLLQHWNLASNSTPDSVVAAHPHVQLGRGH